jgi:hypothetical protein
MKSVIESLIESLIANDCADNTAHCIINLDGSPLEDHIELCKLMACEVACEGQGKTYVFVDGSYLFVACDERSVSYSNAQDFAFRHSGVAGGGGGVDKA